MLFEVAARCERPASGSPLEPAPANAFSISSIHKTDGAIFCPRSKALRSFFHFADKFLVERAGVEARQFESPFTGDRFGGKTLAAALYSGDQNPFRRN